MQVSQYVRGSTCLFLSFPVSGAQNTTGPFRKPGVRLHHLVNEDLTWFSARLRTCGVNQHQHLMYLIYLCTSMSMYILYIHICICIYLCNHDCFVLIMVLVTLWNIIGQMWGGDSQQTMFHSMKTRPWSQQLQYCVGWIGLAPLAHCPTTILYNTIQ